MPDLHRLRLSPLATLVLGVVSLAATIFILAGGGHPSAAVLAARATLAHPRRVLDELTTAPAPTVPTTPTDTGAAVAPPAAPTGGGSGASGGGADTGAAGGTGTGTGSPGTGAAGTTGPAQTSTSTSTGTAASTTPVATDAGLPKVGHVFLITLSTPSYSAAFGAGSALSYLRSLTRLGTVLTGYRGLGRGPLADELAAISGQPPNPDTAAGCSDYPSFPESATVTKAGIARGRGCIYPDSALTVADQATAADRTWGAYIASMGSQNCPVPETGDPIDAPLDGTEAGYDLAHDPFAFFGSLLDNGGCSEYDTDLTKLPGALARAGRTPDLVYLGGDACVDADPTLAPAGSTTATTTVPAPTTTAAATTATVAPATTTTGTASPATGTATTVTTTSTVPARLQAPPAYGCPAGDPAGPAAEDAFLKTWVPEIVTSAAYRRNGVLIIAFTGTGGHAGTSLGALVMSRWTARDHRIATTYTPYSLLHSVEDMLDLQPLADAAHAPAFARAVLR